MQTAIHETDLISGFKIEKDIRSELSKQGYSLITADKLIIPADLLAAKRELVDSWNNLELDDYMADQGKYRLRRYGRLTFTPTTGKLVNQTNLTYFQSNDYNQENGGQERKFAPLEEATVNNAFLRTLARYHFTQLPIKEQHAKWDVGIHQIRIIAAKGEVGKPTPEGIHRDGEPYTIQHLISRKNIEGGTFYICDGNKEVIQSWQQQTPFDTVYVKDDAVMHGVAPIRLKQGATSGLRDVLLIDYTPIL